MVDNEILQMSHNYPFSNDNESNGQERTQCAYYQLGAPSLVYSEKLDETNSWVQVPPHSYPSVSARELQEIFQRQNRIKARWNYTLDLESIQKVALLKSKQKRRKRPRQLPNSNPPMEWTERRDRGRFGMLQQHDIAQERDHVRMVQDYSTYGGKYVDADVVKNRLRNGDLQPKVHAPQAYMFREFHQQHQQSADPAYLAPFPSDALSKCQDSTTKDPKVDHSKATCCPSRPPQGNTLLCVPCPCPACSSTCETNLDDARACASWVLLHPKGILMDTLCISNLLLPRTNPNAGHFFDVSFWDKKVHRRRDKIREIQQAFPNEICLQDTIVDIQQAGRWDSAYLDGVFVVRTQTSVAVLQVSLQKPEVASNVYGYPVDVCWGNYVVREIERIDLRSMVPSAPSYRPSGLTCHPKYGNEFSSPKLAILSYAGHAGDQNTIHHATVGSSRPPELHPISNLRHITSIDFSSTHPMCLWSAAASHVRPALVFDSFYKKQPPLGFGTALYNIDLRTDSASFMWSPSSQLLDIEGVHSLSSVKTDWERDHTVWATSRSAGRTWEIDARMPCKVVNEWSLTWGCEDDSVTFPENGLYGDTVLLSKPADRIEKGYKRTSPIVAVDTTRGAFGFHLLQRPHIRPRFQTKSMECIADPRVTTLDGISLTTSSIHPLPDVSNATHICGVASFRVPTTAFREPGWHTELLSDEDGELLCTLSMTNVGDIHCHYLMESQKVLEGCDSFEGLPVGTRTIPAPTDLDGKTCPVQHKRWKPSGGLNLKLFLSNKYPARFNTSRPVTRPNTATAAIPAVTVTPKESERTRIDDTEVEISVSKTGFVTSAFEGTVVANATTEPIRILPRLAHKSNKRLKIYKPPVVERIGRYDDSEHLKSDMTPLIIQNATRAWDMFGDLDDSDSEDDEIEIS